ncbi:hypothetical protein L596_011085 [Steinernema carpocapsae]|uniref:Uncharacterized protein n=1 Tax=Steinernema carpocapsae TaxID=34508 RepID=A0A4U5NTP3_STECR|nr:hypothetical protein L596_011085 [Steinernema carpocapsae]
MVFHKARVTCYPIVPTHMVVASKALSFPVSIPFKTFPTRRLHKKLLLRIFFVAGVPEELLPGGLLATPRCSSDNQMIYVLSQKDLKNEVL